MGKDNLYHQKNNPIDSVLQEAFGLGDEQLADEYDRVASSEGLVRVPPAAGDEFEAILARLDRRTGKKQEERS